MKIKIVWGKWLHKLKIVTTPIHFIVATIFN